jgi:hypothetical protein
MYKVIRFYRDRYPNRRTIDTGLTLEQARDALAKVEGKD